MYIVLFLQMVTGSWSKVSTFRQSSSNSNEVWEEGEKLLLFADDTKHESLFLLEEFQSVLKSTSIHARGVLIPSSESKAIKFFGVQNLDLPAFGILRTTGKGAARMQKHNLDTTCFPDCKLETFSPEGGLDKASMLEFLEQKKASFDRWLRARAGAVKLEEGKSD
jgi:hypothetical protein